MIYNDFDSKYQIAIRWDGSNSCSGDSNNLIATTNGGDMYFTAGTYQLQSSNHLNLNLTRTANASNKSNIICSGVGSCNGGSIVNFENVFCTGDNSCSFVDYLSDILNNVYMLASQAGQYTNIMNIGNNVYCGGDQSCANSNLMNIKNNTIGNGFEALKNATISNVGNMVIGIGYQAFLGATIRNVSEIHCLGTNACHDVTITNASELVVFNGTNVLNQESTVSTSGNNNNSSDNRVTFVLDGNNDIMNEIYNITCNHGDICNFMCHNTGCSKLIIQCFGLCYVECGNPFTNACPINSIGNPLLPWYSIEPTSIPSKMPSYIPSFSPSVMPSLMPSTDPTLANNDGSTSTVAGTTGSTYSTAAGVTAATSATDATDTTGTEFETPTNSPNDPPTQMLSNSIDVTTTIATLTDTIIGVTQADVDSTYTTILSSGDAGGDSIADASGGSSNDNRDDLIMTIIVCLTVVIISVTIIFTFYTIKKIEIDSTNEITMRLYDQSIQS